ncbi:hypothetical protein G6M16_015125 [Agrobacterium tumefaciens]|nr:hypothetical protein G6M16_015125 [Agrobacterium tumefaciens]
MKTDWTSIRGMLNAAIDACERIEALRYAETDREATTDIGGQEVSVHDFLVSAWTYPEKLRYQIIRERHDTGVDLPYVPETSRILLAMSQAARRLFERLGKVALAVHLKSIATQPNWTLSSFSAQPTVTAVAQR